MGAPSAEASRQRELKICRWLNAVADDATEIYLMGDIFDFWFEYSKVVPKGYVRLLATLAQLTDKGIKITTFKGNHDMWMFGYLEKECGVAIVSNELIIERNNKRLYLHHGDGLGSGDFSYKMLRYIFRSRVCQWLFARLHPNAGIGLANFLSRKSRISQKDRYEQYLGDEKEILTQFCKQTLLKEHYDYFVFGHRHLVLDIDLNGKSRYINTGEWVHGSSYACFNGTKLEVYTFD